MKGAFARLLTHQKLRVTTATAAVQRLDALRTVLGHLGNPQDALSLIHIAGTCGKGSTCLLLEALLRSEGHQVARFTSPHLISPQERLCWNGQPLPLAELEALSAQVWQAVQAKQQLENLGFFDLLTAVALLAFAKRARKHPQSWCILETGIGGTADATNVCQRKRLTLITRIGWDHQALLGPHS